MSKLRYWVSAEAVEEIKPMLESLELGYSVYKVPYPDFNGLSVTFDYNTEVARVSHPNLEDLECLDIEYRSFEETYYFVILINEVNENFWVGPQGYRTRYIDDALKFPSEDLAKDWAASILEGCDPSAKAKVLTMFNETSSKQEVIGVKEV